MWLKLKQWLWEIGFQAYGFRIPLVLIIGIVVFIGGYQIVQNRLNQEKWETLRSDELSYKIDYPASWSAETFPAGFKNPHRGLPDGIRAFFFHEFLMGVDKKTVALYWIPMKEPDLMEAVKWGNETIEQDRKSVGIQKVHVGVGQYPAITRIYPVDAGKRRVVYILSNDGVYVLKFIAKNYDEKYETIVEYMLSSFEILGQEKNDSF
ncbi:MAG: hypothetical protein GY928_07300 [Colwellia sp.]|nr:hypothetical protein [Colwellia sp.]